MKRGRRVALAHPPQRCTPHKAGSLYRKACSLNIKAVSLCTPYKAASLYIKAGSLYVPCKGRFTLYKG
jgi:hypothetical protein